MAHQITFFILRICAKVNITFYLFVVNSHGFKFKLYLSLFNVVNCAITVQAYTIFNVGPLVEYSKWLLVESVS